MLKITIIFLIFAFDIDFDQILIECFGSESVTMTKRWHRFLKLLTMLTQSLN